VEAYGDIALRSFNDLDLLVPPERAWDAVQLLLAQGYQLDFDLLQTRWPALQKTVNHLFLKHQEYDWGVEIHWQLFHPMYVSSFDLSGYWNELEEGQEGRLTREDLLAILSAHGAMHSWGQLKWLVDIDRLIRNGPAPNWEKVLSLASRSESTRALLLGMNLTRRLCGTPVPIVVTEKIDGDDQVQSLTESVISNLFPEDSRSGRPLQDYTFYLRTRDHKPDRLRQVFRWLFWPRLADWLVFPAGDQCFWLYYIERPLRMVWKWILTPFFQKRENQ
jgi:hypothetical protein